MSKLYVMIGDIRHSVDSISNTLSETVPDLLSETDPFGPEDPQQIT